MVENMLENGMIIICTAEDCILGKMAENMMVTMIMIRSMVSEFINGQMV